MEKTDFSPYLYQKNPQLVFGFHGCSREVAEKVLNSPSEHLYKSDNEYDWLGQGVYFWLNDPQRALEWAQGSKTIKDPFVIGAVIDLGLCLNFCERSSIELLKKSYVSLKKTFETAGLNIHKHFKNKRKDEGGFTTLRPLDCAVIDHLHSMVEKHGISYDTVYGYFQEGGSAFEGAGIQAKSHIQICVRNLDCIKGYFIPRLGCREGTESSES